MRAGRRERRRRRRRTSAASARASSRATARPTSSSAIRSPSLREDAPRRRRRRGAVRRGHELAADGRDPRAARPRLLRVVLGRRQRAVRPVRDRGVDRAGAARRVPGRGAAPARGAGRARSPPAELERAKKQIAVRTLRAQERPSRRLEDAALDLFVHGRVRSRAELLARVEAVDARRRARRVRAHAGGAAGAGDRRPDEEGRQRARPRAVREHDADAASASVITRFIDSGQPAGSGADRIVGAWPKTDAVDSSADEEQRQIPRATRRPPAAPIRQETDMSFTHLAARRPIGARGLAAAVACRLRRGRPRPRGVGADQAGRVRRARRHRRRRRPDGAPDPGHRRQAQADEAVADRRQQVAAAPAPRASST